MKQTIFVNIQIFLTHACLSVKSSSPVLSTDGLDALLSSLDVSHLASAVEGLQRQDPSQTLYEGVTKAAESLAARAEAVTAAAKQPLQADALEVAQVVTKIHSLNEIIRKFRGFVESAKNSKKSFKTMRSLVQLAARDARKTLEALQTLGRAINAGKTEKEFVKDLEDALNEVGDLEKIYPQTNPTMWVAVGGCFAALAVGAYFLILCFCVFTYCLQRFGLNTLWPHSHFYSHATRLVVLSTSNNY